MKILLINRNGQKAGRSAAFPVLLASFCVRYTPFIALEWCKEIDFLNALDIHPSPEFFLVSLHCSGRGGGIWHLFTRALSACLNELLTEAFGISLLIRAVLFV